MELTPKVAVESLLAVLPKRSAVVLEKRFGLGKSGKRFTLDAIGKTYDITRERIRQIECDALKRVQKNPVYAQLHVLFSDFRRVIIENGGVSSESDIVTHFDTNGSSANIIRFLLVLSPDLIFRGETDEFHARWGDNATIMDTVENSLRSIANILAARTETISHNELLVLFENDFLSRYNENSPGLLTLKKFIDLSKKIGENCFGQWGHTSSALICPRGVRDLAYLVFQKENVPMHFSTAAERIHAVVAPRQIHAQTVHNELIKDNRFVLVGRGTYGLLEWGYERGTVCDIITRILVNGPQNREEIVRRTLKKRHVKENTVLINLQNKKYFKKLNDGTYSNII